MRVDMYPVARSISSRRHPTIPCGISSHGLWIEIHAYFGCDRGVAAGA
jgi:hypothetical protein